MTKEKLLDVTVGCDLGAKTVATTAINPDYNIFRKYHKRMVEINISEEHNGRDNASRRAYRSHRRTLNHRQWRKKQLVRWFKANNSKFDVDRVTHYYKKSWIAKSDIKRSKPKTTIYLHNQIKGLKYPTVWHAAQALIDNVQSNLPKTEAGRRQLIFEVLYNLLGRRGHFLEPSLRVQQFVGKSIDFTEMGQQLQTALTTAFGNLDLAFDLDKFNYVMSGQAANDAKNNGEEVKSFAVYMQEMAFPVKNSGRKQTDVDKLHKGIVKLMNGNAMDKATKVLFGMAGYGSTLKFSGNNVDEIMADLLTTISPEKYQLLDMLRQVYEARQTMQLIYPKMTFVESRLEDYRQFGQDLVILKQAVKKALVDNVDYIGDFKKGMDQYIHAFKGRHKGAMTFADFDKKFLMQIRAPKKKKDGKPDICYNLLPYLSGEVMDRIRHHDFMIKTRSIKNGQIPHQAIQGIVRAIVDVQKTNWPELGKRDHQDDWFNDENYDVERFYDFCIPYFVGPAVKNNDESPFSWLKRKDADDPGTLTVFNFTKKIDFAGSSFEFMNKLIGRDLYLLDQPVMPASSLTYQKFKVLDELSNLRIKEQKWSSYRPLSGTEISYLISSEASKNHALFNKVKLVSLKSVFLALQQHFGYFEGIDDKACDVMIHGLADAAKNKNKAHFQNAFTTKQSLLKVGITPIQFNLHEEDIDKIVEYLTVFDSRSWKIKEEALHDFKWLSDEMIHKLSRLSFDGWGRLSHKLLVDLESTNSEHENVMYYLQYSKLNLMQILRDKDLGFKQQIDKHKKDILSKLSVDEQIDLLLGPRYISPDVRRMLGKFVKSMKRTKIWLGGSPKMICIESTRPMEKQEASNAQMKTRLKKLFDDNKGNSAVDVVAKMYDHWSGDFTKKAYLYFMQQCCDIYSGERIEINDLVNCQIDHVVPRSQTTDNSLDNLVLTKRINNQVKGGNTPVQHQKNFWLQLKKQGFLSTKKFENLMRKAGLISEDDEVKFLNRSLVETSQINKLACQIATIMFPDSQIMMLSSELTTKLRNLGYQKLAQLRYAGKLNEIDNIQHDVLDKYNIYKNRQVNDLHHGVDAYLIAFAGQYLCNKYGDWMEKMLNYNEYLPFGDKKKVLANKKRKFADYLFRDLTDPAKGEEKILNKLLALQDQRLVNNVRYESGLSLKGRAVVNKITIHPRGDSKSAIQRHKGWDTRAYGYFANGSKRYFVVVKHGEKYRFVWIPITMEQELLGLKNKEKLKQYVTDWLIAQNKWNGKLPIKIVSKPLQIGQKMEFEGTGFNFKLQGNSKLRLVKQLILLNSDIGIINAFDKYSVNDIRNVLIHIIEYERKINGYAGILFTTSFGLALSDTVLNIVNEINDKKVLIDLINKYLCAFHPNGSYVDKKFDIIGAKKKVTMPMHFGAMSFDERSRTWNDLPAVIK